MILTPWFVFALLVALLACAVGWTVSLVSLANSCRKLALLPQPVMLVDLRRLRLLQINRAMQRELGYSLAHIMRIAHRIVPEILHPDDIARLPQILDRWKTASDQEVIEEVIRLRNHEGNWLWFEVGFVSYRRSRTGEVEQILGTLRNIDRRKHAEDALIASEARLRNVVTNSPGVAVQFYDSEGRVKLWNKASEHMFGFTEAEALNQTLDKLIHTPDEFQVFLEALQTIKYKREAIGPAEYPFRRRSGTRGTCLSTLFQIPGPENADWFVCMDVDVTERKLAEETLRQILKLISSTTGQPFFTELANQLSLICEVDYALVGVADEHNSDLIHVISGAYRGAAIPNISYTLSGTPCDDAMREEFCYVPNQVQEKYPRDTMLVDMKMDSYMGMSLRDDHGVAIGIIVLMHGREMSKPRHAEAVLRVVASRVAAELQRKRSEDRQRQLEQKLAEARRMEALGRLAGGVAHDFNNILTVVSSYSEMLEPAFAGDAAKIAMLTGIRDAAHRAAALTQQLLTVSRQQSPEQKILDLNRIVSEAEPLLRGLTISGIELELQLSPSPALVLGNATQFEQILTNLVVNARDAMSSGGRLLIAVGREQRNFDHAPHASRFVTLTVADSGHGIPSHIQTSIFDPFFSTKGTGSGRGLGLSTVKAIVEQAGGFIHLQTEVDHGTTFTVYFPAWNDQPVEPLADDTPPTPLATNLLPRARNILLLEDDPAVRRVTRQLLESFDCRVYEAPHGAAALDFVAHSSADIDLLVTDIHMPGLNGIETYERLQASLPGLKALFLSGFADEPALGQLMGSPRVSYLQKPFTQAVLTTAVRELLELSEASSAMELESASNT